jgi:hypothetical protein
MTSWNPDQDITVYSYLYADGQLLDSHSAWGYSPTTSVHGSVTASDHDISVECYVDGAGVSVSDSAIVPAEETPYTEIASDTGDYPWGDDATRRDIWYQIRRTNGQAWPYRGQVVEDVQPLSNPCNFQIETGQQQADSSGRFLDTYYTSPLFKWPNNCDVVAWQFYRLSTASYNIIRTQRVTWAYMSTTIVQY